MKVKIIKAPRNAAKWHALGGDLNSNGINWDDGISYIGNGNTHENNINGGVQIGVDQQGIPNLVEEGEVVWNDFVFSNRIDVPKEMKKEYKLQGKTFADAAKNAMKESSERPNDLISQRSLEDSLTKLAVAQEGIKERKRAKSKGNTFDWGGSTGNPYTSWMATAPKYDSSTILETSGVGNSNYLMPYLTSSLGLEKMGVTTPSVGYTPKVSVNSVLSNMGSTPRTVISVPTKTKNSTTPIVSKKDTPLFKESVIPEDDFILDESLTDSIANLNDYRDRQKSISKFKTPWESYLRYAPVLGSGITAITDLAGLTNKPDYTVSRGIKNYLDNVGTSSVKAKQLGNYLKYDPMDVNYFTNKLGAQAASTRRSIENLSGGNRATAMANLLAQDYNANENLGDFYRKAREYNLAQRERVGAFNRGTDQYNAESSLRADLANQAKETELNRLKMQGLLAASEAYSKENLLSSQNKSANIANLFTNLGNVGIDAMNRFDRNMLIKSGVLGNYSYQDLLNAGFSKKQAADQLRNQGWTDDELKSKGYIKACGGKIKTKKKRGLTY